MQQEHSFSQWMCTSTAHEEDLPFDTVEDFEDHMRNEHSETFEESELPVISESSVVHLPWTETLPICPLCDDTPEEADIDALRYHIADHLQPLAMIPFLGLNDDDEKASNYSASRVTFFMEDEKDHFGYSIGDFAAFSQLAWNVYRSCKMSDCLRYKNRADRSFLCRQTRRRFI
jgi:hypothetical protein